MGEHDLVQDALRAFGMKLSFYKIAMRPGKPLMFGKLKKMRVLGLPGNPVSAIVCARLFLKPLWCIEEEPGYKALHDGLSDFAGVTRLFDDPPNESR